MCVSVVTRTGGDRSHFQIGQQSTKEFLKFGRSFVRALRILIGYFSELLGHILTVQAGVV